MNCYQDLVEAAKKYDYKFGLEYFNSKTKIKDFIKDVDKIATYLQKNGVKKDSVYIINLPNTPQAFAFFYALNKLGAIANIVHPLTPINTLKKSVEQTNSKGVIVLDILANEHVEDLKTINTQFIVAKNSDYVKGLKNLCFKTYEFFKTKNLKNLKNAIFYKDAIKQVKENQLCPITKNDVAVYIHSGGTSGETKTIVLSNSSIVHLSNEVAKFNQRNGPEYSPIVLPIFHAYGLSIGVHTLLKLGYTGVIFPKFDAKKVNKTLKKYKVTTLISVPLMILKMMREKHFYGPHLKHLSRVYCGGDVVGTQLQTDFNTALEKYGSKGKLLAGYGLTETCSVVTVNTLDNYRFGSCGKPLSNTKIEIWDEDEEVLPANKVGEIVITGKTIMNGYLHTEDDGITTKNGIDYVKTGDLGFIDEDGFIYVSGRKKRLIKIAAYNIFPSEIEDTILKLPYIEEVCAFEKKVDGKNYIKVIMTLRKTATLIDKEIILKEVKEHCKTHLIKYALPCEYEIISDLPHTNMSKIDVVKIANVY
ncbi:MAG: AMP-binding protein [Christensenellales bacterium]|jgi:long-chain acyl-CoA synthetase